MAEKTFIGGVTNTVIHTETDGTVHVEEQQDVEPILDWTNALRNQRFSGETSDFGVYEGEVPVTIYLKEAKKQGLDHHKAMQALGTAQGDMILTSILYDPQYAKFRAAPTLRDPRLIVKGVR